MPLGQRAVVFFFFWVRQVAILSQAALKLAARSDCNGPSDVFNDRQLAKQRRSLGGRRSDPSQRPFKHLPHPLDDNAGGWGVEGGQGHTAGAPSSVCPVSAHNGTERRAVREESNLSAMTNAHGDAVAEHHKYNLTDLPTEPT